MKKVLAWTVLGFVGATIFLSLSAAAGSVLKLLFAIAVIALVVTVAAIVVWAFDVVTDQDHFDSWY